MAAAKKGGRKAPKSSKKDFVNRNEIVAAVAKQIKVPQTTVLAVLDATLGTIKATVKAGTPVRFNNFGTWKKVHRKARTISSFGKGGAKARRVRKTIGAHQAAAFKVSGEFLA